MDWMSNRVLQPIGDEWIDGIETLRERLGEYINTQKTATGFDQR